MKKLKLGLQPKQSFSLEDMKKAMELGLTLIPYNEYNQKHFDDFIQSLSTQQLPKEFIPEISSESLDNGYEIIIKEGKKELVGEYKYD